MERRGILSPIIDRLTSRATDRATARILGALKSVSIRPTDPILAKILGIGGKDEKLSEPYRQVSMVYACVNAKARNVAQVPFRIYRKGSDVPIEQGRAFDLFESPNPYMSKFELWESIVVNLDLSGEWHLVKDPDMQDGLPVALWSYPSKSYKPKFRDGQWVAWELDKGDGNGPQVVLRDQIIFDRYYSPYSQIRGLSPLDAIRLSLESDFSASVYNRNFFGNDAAPRAVYTTEQNLNPSQVEQLTQQLIKKRQGAEHAHTSQLLWGGLDVKQLGLSQKDMEFLEQRKFTREEVCMIYKVPKSEISLFEDVNYATALSADRAFWQKTLVPLMKRIENKLDRDLLAPAGYYGRFDTKVIDALNYALLEKVDAAAKLWGIGVPLNALNERLDLGFEEQPWGDEPSPASQASAVPFDSSTNAGKGLAEITNDPRFPGEEVGMAARAALWKSLVSRVTPIQAKLNRELKNYFHECEQKLLRKVTRGAGEEMRLKMSSEPVPETAIDEAFNDEKLRRIVSQYLTLSFSTGVESIAATRFDLESDAAKAAIGNRLAKIAEVNETARDQLKASLQDALKQVIDQGLTEREAADLIVKTVKDQMDNIGRRARTIARTETHAAYSEGRFASAASTNPSAKKWISSRDALVRDSHRHLDGQVTPWAGEFTNGLRYPLDSRGAAEEVINCRCVMVPVYGSEEKTIEHAQGFSPEEELRPEPRDAAVSSALGELSSSAHEAIDKGAQEMRAALQQRIRAAEERLQKAERLPRRKVIRSIQRDELNNIIGAEIDETVGEE
jgi:HK97 family phage portal protein